MTIFESPSQSDRNTDKKWWKHESSCHLHRSLVKLILDSSVPDWRLKKNQTLTSWQLFLFVQFHILITWTPPGGQGFQGSSRWNLTFRFFTSVTDLRWPHWVWSKLFLLMVASDDWQLTSMATDRLQPEQLCIKHICHITHMLHSIFTEKVQEVLFHQKVGNFKVLEPSFDELKGSHVPL